MSEHQIPFEHMGVTYIVSFSFQEGKPNNLSLWTNTTPKNLIYNTITGWETDQVFNVRPKVLHIAGIVCQDYIDDNLT